MIRNGRIDLQTRVTKRKLGSISGNSISTMLKVSGINDLYRLYVGQLTGELEFYYVAFPVGYVPVSAEEFNKEEMNKEYELGYKWVAKACRGNACRRATGPKRGCWKGTAAV